MPMGDRIGHAELQIGDSHVMLADEFPDMGHLGPKTPRRDRPPASSSTSRTSTPPSSKAIDAGGTQKRAVENQF